MQSVTRRSSVWPRVVMWISLLGLAGAILWGFLTYQGLQDRLAGLDRTFVPGEVVVTVPKPQLVTVFYEDPFGEGGFVIRTSDTSTASSPVEIGITGPSGEVVSSARYERDLRFDYDGRVVVALATFDATVAGDYTVAATGDVSTSALVSVGEVVDFSLVANAGGAVILLVGSFLGILISGVVRIAGRRPTNPAVGTPERPLARV